MATIQGTAGPDNITGTPADDLIFASSGNDIVDGGAGNDTIYGYQNLSDADSDRLLGGLGNDTIYSGSGADYVDGGGGDDFINSYGSTGDHVLIGGDGNDTIYGGSGNDILDGGTGKNSLFGDAGNDTYLVKDIHTYIYDSGGVNSGVISVDFFKPTNGITWAWADGVQKLPYWIDALVEDRAPGYISIGETKTYKYFFPTAPPDYLSGKDLTEWRALNTAQIDFVKSIFSSIATYLDVKFVAASNPNEIDVFTFQFNSQTSSSGYASYPANSTYGDAGKYGANDVFIKNSGLDNFSDGQSVARVLIHEIGHALGLKHPFSHPDALGQLGDGPFLPDFEDRSNLAQMSYTVAPDTFHAVYGPLDLQALFYLYGVNPSYNSSNNTYVLSSTTANFLVDGSGIDTVDASAAAWNVMFHMSPGYWDWIGAQGAGISSGGQITVSFGTVLENVTAGSGSDQVWGNAVANSISLGAGNDRVQGLGANDVLDGGAGLDTSSYRGAWSEYQLSTTGLTTTVADSVADRDGVDQLTNVERLQFKDGYVAFDTSGNAGMMYRLYQAAFDRTPDKPGLGYWIREFDKGAEDLAAVANNFILSAEFQSKYGTPATVTNNQFIGLLYQNVLDRSPDAAGLDYWNSTMNLGLSRERVLASFSESSENIQKVAVAVRDGILYE